MGVFKSLRWGADSAVEQGRGSALRIAVIDIGSNSVRLVVFDSATRTPAVFYNEKKLCGLGETLESDNRLSAEGRRRCLSALRRFLALTEYHGVAEVVAVGTAALREAEDGPDFVEQVRRELGLEIRVAAGEDEARLAAQGVLLGDPFASGFVADMGGASMELVELHPDGVASTGVTTPLGPLRLLGWKAQSGERRDAKVDKILSEAVQKFDGRLKKAPALYVLGGSWRALVNCYMEKNDYPLRVLHGFSMPYSEAVAAAEWVSTLKAEQVMELAGVSESRAVVTPPAAAVLARLLQQVKPKKVVLSAFGLREGVIWELMPKELRDRDPLLDACSQLEKTSSRMAGFGNDLWAWLRPALEPFQPGELRLAQAACLLADANWRTHPDYRSRSSFELVTRTTMGGVDHEDRLYLAAALINRFKGGRKAMKQERALDLLSPERRQRAEALGRGMRLGVMMAGAAPGRLEASPLLREGEGLTLKLGVGAENLFDEEVSKRFENFAIGLGLTPEIHMSAAK